MQKRKGLLIYGQVWTIVYYVGIIVTKLGGYQSARQF